MNKYDKPEIIVNRLHNQFNMTASNYNQNDGQHFRHIHPGNAGIRNPGMPIQNTMPLQSNLFNINLGSCQGYYPPQNCYVANNQYITPIMNNFPMQPNTYRQNILTYGQPSNVFSSVDKMNATPSPNYVYSTTMPQLYHQQNPQITHIPQISQISQISPHLQPQIHSQIQQTQLTNQFAIPEHHRPQYVPLVAVNEKHTKINSALEIFNPETKKSVDLTVYKNVKTTVKTHTSDSHIEKKESFEFPFDKTPNIVICNDKSKQEDTENERNKLVETTTSSSMTTQLQDHQTTTNNKGSSDMLLTEKTEHLENCADSDDHSKTNIDNIPLVQPDAERSILKRPFSSGYSSENSNLSNPISAEPQEIHEETQPDLINNDSKEIVSECITLEVNQDSIDSSVHLNKYIYSRDELIKIGKNNLSRRKPKGLPYKEEFTDPIILDHSMDISGLENMESMHAINQKFPKVHKTSQSGPISWRNMNLKNMNSFPKYINLGNTEHFLPRSDDSYITCRQRLAAGEELSETEELIRQIKGILNRIVPQNFDQCLDDLVSLKIGTHEGMTCLVNELFLKAVKEEAYSVTFAKICYYLAQIKADVSDHEIVTFRSVLLQKCQMMFTTPLKEQLENVRNEWLLKASNEKPKTKALMESDVDEQIKKAKDRYYGNIRFIGELYLKGVLITKIICFCIENLLTKENDADSLICLCKLLETCGAKLETENKGKEKLNDSFKKLQELSESLIIETRVRFRILDIMEMRQQKWCLRKVQQEQKIEPKTLEEIKIDKNIEEEKDYCSSLNRKTVNNWPTDRRQSLPNVNKSRPGIVPKNLSVTCSNDSPTLGPQKRNWIAGSGSTINAHSFDGERRVNKQKGKTNSDIRSKDGIYALDNPESAHNQTLDGCVSSNYPNCLTNPQSFNQSYQSTNSSENSSRSSSHGRSTPQIFSKEKLPNSKLAQPVSVDTGLVSPFELFKEYLNSNLITEENWNACTNKVDVVYQWLDSNFDTNSDNRICLSNFLAMLINQNMMIKVDLLNAFSKLIDSLEDLIIDIGNSIWNSLSDYLIPFLENMELDVIDLIESIFDFEALKNFSDKNASIIYSLPWSMTNKILKCSSVQKCRDVYQLSLECEELDSMTNGEQKLISIVSKNLFRAIKIVSQISEDFYCNWLVLRHEESFSNHSQQFFIRSNWEAMFHEIQIDTFKATKYLESFKKIPTLSKNNEVFCTLCKICNNSNTTLEGIYSILRCLLETKTCDLQTFHAWESQLYNQINSPSKLKDVLTVLNKSAFISDNSFESLFSFDGSTNCFSL